MSRGFVREEDQEEAPIVPPRAALPEGVVNYVTPEGLKQLKEEFETLEKERRSLSLKHDADHRRASALLVAKQNLLSDRINNARVVNPDEQPQDEVRFGARVTFQDLKTKQMQTFTIVGVDEADVALNKISFLAPIAIALTGGKKNDEIIFRLGAEKRLLKIVGIEY